MASGRRDIWLPGHLPFAPPKTSAWQRLRELSSGYRRARRLRHACCLRTSLASVSSPVTNQPASNDQSPIKLPSSSCGMLARRRRQCGPKASACLKNADPKPGLCWGSRRAAAGRFRAVLALAMPRLLAPACRVGGPAGSTGRLTLFRDSGSTGVAGNGTVVASSWGCSDAGHVLLRWPATALSTERSVAANSGSAVVVNSHDLRGPPP